MERSCMRRKLNERGEPLHVSITWLRIAPISLLPLVFCPNAGGSS